jgi:inward rectifier potassium channel
MESCRTMAKSVTSKTALATVTHHGLETSGFRDFYHNMLTLSWIRYLMVMVAGYLVINLFFGLIYFSLPGGIANAEPGSFLHAYAFSVQTMATIGYGVFSPQTPLAHGTVILESIVSLIYTALCTGLTFAKFSRPNARIRFSKTAILTKFEGADALMFRIANARTNVVLQASVRVAAVKNVITDQGYRMRRQFDLTLVRDNSMVFVLPWTVIHKIDEKSPLYGLSKDDMEACDLSLAIAMAGIDDIFSSQIHAFHSYQYKDLEPAVRFVDMMSFDKSRHGRVDHHLLSEVVK